MAQSPLEHIEDDGLHTPRVGPWAEEKYRIVALYDTLFSTGMKNKWKRAYIDLYAGAGHAKIKGTNRIVRGSPLLALNVTDKFDKYVFCEKNRKCLSALKQRVSRKLPNVAPEFISGDCNEKASEILGKIPEGMLSLCFIDPFNIGLHFDTVRCLSKKRMDFLIVLPTGMDAHRNQERYFDQNNTRIARFLGKPDWRACKLPRQGDTVKGELLASS
jgi:three-Cys-motif partner protein